MNLILNAYIIMIFDIYLTFWLNREYYKTLLSFNCIYFLWFRNSTLFNSLIAWIYVCQLSKQSNFHTSKLVKETRFLHCIVIFSICIISVNMMYWDLRAKVIYLIFYVDGNQSMVIWSLPSLYFTHCVYIHDIH